MTILDKIFGNRKNISAKVSENHNEKKKTAPELTPEKKAYMEKFCEDDSPGWDAINAALNNVYPDTCERHYATLIKYIFGGKDPLDGISIYDNHSQTFHRHIVSYGMSELYYDLDSADKEYSRWGFEFTMRTVPFEEDQDTERTDGTIARNEPFWAMNLMQNLARYVYESGNYFDAYHFIPAHSPIRTETDTKLTGIVFAPDPQLDGINTPNGRVQFLQMIGVTQRELDWLFEDPKTVRAKALVDKMRKDNPFLITDLKRTKEYV